MSFRAAARDAPDFRQYCILGREGKPSRFIKNEPLILDKCLVAEPELETKTEYKTEYMKAELQTAGGRVYPLTKVGLISVKFILPSVLISALP